jgi:hypothetical protein
MMKLRDWAPIEFEQSFYDTRAFQYADVEVVEEYGYNEKWKPWPGTHKNVMNWCILKNGYAVGWNENPSVGWSFPVKKMKG